MVADQRNILQQLLQQHQSLIELPERLSQIRNLRPRDVWLGMDWEPDHPVHCC